MNNKPNKWLAFFLGFFFSSLGLLYVRRLKAAILFALLMIFIMVPLELLFLKNALVLLTLNVVFCLSCAVFSYHYAVHTDGSLVRPAYSRWYGLLGIFLGFTLAVALFRSFAYEPFQAPSASMEPTVPRGSVILVKKWGYGHYSAFGIPFLRTDIAAPLRHGDMIAFDFPENIKQSFIKRIIGLPGDQVAYIDGILSVNGKPFTYRQKEDYPVPELLNTLPRFTETMDGFSHDILADQLGIIIPSRVRDFAYREKCLYNEHGLRCEVPPGQYYVMGDNRPNSLDSRYWGFVPADHVIGKVVLVRP